TGAAAVAEACDWNQVFARMKAERSTARDVETAKRTSDSTRVADVARNSTIVRDAAGAYQRALAMSLAPQEADVGLRLLSGDGGNGHLPISNGIFGTVSVRFVVDTSGRVVGAVGSSDNGDELLGRAIVAVLNRKYSPATKAGVKVAIHAGQLITFP